MSFMLFLLNYKFCMGGRPDGRMAGRKVILMPPTWPSTDDQLKLVEVQLVSSGKVWVWECRR